jgi:hypothetical protein
VKNKEKIQEKDEEKQKEKEKQPITDMSEMVCLLTHFIFIQVARNR